MASGGMPYSKKDSKQRSNWQRSTSYSDRDDAHSLNSVPNDVRINNWDFSDWRPNSQSVDVKRRKKSKGNPEREREQSLSLDSPPHREGEKKHRTPQTFPRTKITPSTPTQTRVALENLRQQLTFSDLDDQYSTDGEPNNERLMKSRRRHGSNYSRRETGGQGERGGAHTVPGSDGLTATAAASDGPREVRSNRNNNRDDTSTRAEAGPDSNQIVGRLMQIRDYIKQANSMMDSLRKRGDPEDEQKASKLSQVIKSLKEQEHTSMENLQKLWAIRDDTIPFENGASARGEREGEEKRDSDETVSVELEVDTDASETTENTQSSSSRPRIEDKLGADSADESGDSNTSRGDSDNMDNTVIPGLPGRRSHWVGIEEASNDMDEKDASTARQGELENLKRQEELLQILVDKQEQLKMLQERQETLLSMRSKCEKKLVAAQAKERAVATSQALMDAMEVQDETEPKSNIVGYPESEADDDSNAELPDELLELRRHMHVLKNELKSQSNEGRGEAEIPLAEVGEQMLQDKLKDLQDKKKKMNSLLRELEGLRTYRQDLLNGEGPEESADQEPNQELIPELSEPELQASVQGAQQLMEAQEKLTKLREVRERLNQLRELVSYYQSVKGEGGEGEGGEQSSVAGYSDFGPESNPEAMLQQLIQQMNPEFVQEISAEAPSGVSQPMINLPPGPPAEEQSDEENASNSESNKESQLSSLGPWGDDPEIQEKVQKLRAAKEKLRQLQDIVAMVQQSPSNVPDLPDNMLELATSEDGEVVPPSTDRNMSISDGEVVVSHDKETGDEARQMATIQHQRDELHNLREERERLLAVHSALQNLQDQFEITESEEPVPRKQKGGSGQSGAPVVTFASNDELYSKMRKQRILREELRQKKKELEAIMRKDRNKKQYFRNQDNHSDTVSYSTDAFAASASADATMATWGGSTVDNLGSITEDEDGNDPEAAQEDDDGFPSDGIVQVEEEEEENDSDGTYTIEEDARQRRSERSRRIQHGEGARPKLTKASIAAGTQACPRPMRKQDESTRPKQASRLTKKKGKMTKRERRIKQENYLSAEEIVQEEEEQGGHSLGVLQQQLERTSQMCQALLLDQQSVSPSQGMMSPSGFGLPMRGGGGMMPDMLQQQVHQQQLMLCLNQCYQQLAVQQGEMQTIQQQLHGLTLQVADSHSDNREDQRPNSAYPSRITTPMTTSYSTMPNSSASFNMQSTRQTSFSLNPQFPSSFNYQRPSGYNADSGNKSRDPRSSERQDTQINNLRPIPPPRTDSYAQSEDRAYLNQQANNTNSTSAFWNERNPDGTRATRLNLQDVLSSKVSKSKQRTTATQSEEGMKRYSSPSQPGASTDRSGGRYRPGLSAGISGAGFHDGTSLSSIVSARLSDAGRSRNLRDGDTSGDLSLFEALRETIYSEVATLISQNENRPHFLIELFRILQVLNTDYLRQRGLYSIQELVSRTLTEDNSDSFAAPTPIWMTAAAGNCTPSELTPSESLATSDGEEVKARLRERVAMAQRSRHPDLLVEVNGSLKNDDFDYAEKVENTSSLSTPSNSLWDSPFAQDSLGDTVIHFDKALEKMREYEKFKMESERKLGAEHGAEGGRVREGRQLSVAEQLQSAAANMDQGSESSMSDMQYPRIDTNQLDQQIKSIMTEVIPVIKEHMEDACSPQLLAYIKRLVLSLTRQHDNGQEFARFFHRQLGSILQDSMTKFEGRKMRECGEEMLVDMSEVLFNELAFFRLMQDLDEPTIADKIRTNSWFQTVSEKTAPSSKKVAALVGEESDTSETSTRASDDDKVPSTLRMTGTEEEDLGKDRDDELATEMPIQDAEEKDDDPESPYKAGGGLQIELAVSETKPFTRIGSDEDDDEADESQSMEDPSETAVSRDNKLEHADPDDDAASVEVIEVEQIVFTEVVSVYEEKDADTKQSSETSEADGTVTGASASPEKKADAARENIKQAEAHVNGEIPVNGEIEPNELTVDDLPAALTISGPSNLEQKLDEEQKLTSGTVGIMISMETSAELVGDGTTLPEPGESQV